ncbi:3-beta hydroxysteroid dehydrogenase [Streptomyces sp. CS113]|uniref:SDR family oxidoreductase n=1 Tax=Streptomyces sp. CS113 TaxID=1982761 RepID=UPI000B41A303|nr:NAD(P)H-binding protein [Streptomyces sp. CS113]OWA13911.1 3-beta hydroxysteroid dehydrogenase [Streptomyces sp. CS113]
MRIAVAGGTGWMGKLIVEALRENGHGPVVLARSTGVDLTTGAGLAKALDGVDTVVDVSNVVTTSRARSVAFFEAATTHLLRAEEAAGVGHHLVLSIVGCDRVAMGYYLGKLRQEELVRRGRVPYTVLRATQWHEFAAQTLARGGPLVIAPRMRCQPIAAAEVAAHLTELVEGDPRGLAPELAGPEVHEMVDMVRRLQRARGGRRPVLPVKLPGSVGRAMTTTGLLPQDPGPRGRVTFDEWVAARGRVA